MRGGPAKRTAASAPRITFEQQEIPTMKVGTSTTAFAISAILIGAAPLAARAQTITTSVTTESGQVGASETTKMTATVVLIDVGSRDVVLIDSKGKMHKVN